MTRFTGAKRKTPANTGVFSRWQVVDSNHCRQSRRIYSPLPLAARATRLASQIGGFRGLAPRARTTPVPIFRRECLTVSLAGPVYSGGCGRVSQVAGVCTVGHMSTATQPKWLTTQEVCDLLGVSYDTFAKWRGKGTAPRSKRLPNGSLRFRSDWVDDWMDDL